MDHFDLLLEELGKLLNLELSQGDKPAAAILYNDEVKIQLEMDSNGRDFALIAELGTVPPGAYRARLFEAALKANGMPIPPSGRLGFSEPRDSLVLFEQFPLHSTSADELKKFIDNFGVKAQQWQEDLNAGRVPHVGSQATEGGSILGDPGMRP